MKVRYVLIVVFVVAGLFAAGSACLNDKEPVIKVWTKVIDGKDVHYMTIDGIMVHEKDPAKQPPPPVVTPGTQPLGDTPGTPPSDAVVLFDGTEGMFKSNWEHVSSRKTKWIYKDGAMVPVKRAGDLRTKQKFGSCQLHVEFATPAIIEKEGQGRGNSGVFLMGQYEVQILDSFENVTYADGQLGSLYGRKVPLANPARKPGQWQSYDIIFDRPIFDKDGKVVRKAVFTVLLNGVLMQKNVILSGGTGWRGQNCATNYRAHADKLPLQIQNHGNEVIFRNIWVRELDD